MQAGRRPSHREHHVDASWDYVVAEGGNARAAICLSASPPEITEPFVRVAGQHDTAALQGMRG
jgi:hypothetical protein